MEDVTALGKFLKFKWVFIGIFLLIIIAFIAYFSGKAMNENNLKNYLKDQGYSFENNVYFKTINKSDDDKNSIVNYIYSIKANKFIKHIETSTNALRETIDIEYNGTNNVVISYYAENADSSLSQSADYNLKNKNIECKIITVKGNHTSQCKTIKQQANTFASEIKDINNKANINELFTVKNSKKI